MHRFLVEPEQLTDQMAYITGAEAHHLQRVLRLGPGDVVEVGDGQGRAFRARLVGEESGVWKAKLLAPILGRTEPQVRVVLAVALTKGDKMDWIIQKGTELGVHIFAPFAGSRSVVKLTAVKARTRQVRWQRIATEAAKQCGRFFVPRVDEVGKLSEILGRYGEGALVVLPWEGEESQGLGEVLREGQEQCIVAVIGPEGGFSKEEVVRVKAQGAQVVTLGPRILRTETAALATVAMVLYERGDLGKGTDLDKV